MSAVTAQFIRYLLTGGAAALANYASRFVFSTWVAFELAVAMAFFVGLCVGFALMRMFAFNPGRRPLSAQIMAYVAVNLLGVAQTLVISSALLRIGLPAIGLQLHAEAIAHGIGIAVPVVTSYFGHRRFTFR